MTSSSIQGTSANLQWHISFPKTSDSTDFPFWKYDFPREIWDVRPASQIAVKVATFIPIMLLGLIGNGAVLFLVCRRKTMRTPVNLLLASMAVSDLFVASVLPSLTMVEDFFQNWVLGPVMCKLEGFLMLLLTLAGALTLVAVSLLRLISIAAPASVIQARLTPTAAIRLAILIWLVAAILATPLLRWRHYRERQWRNFTEKYCTENQELLGLYWLVLGALLVWLPLVAILASYAVIFVRLEMTARRATRRGSGAPAATRGRDRVGIMLCVASAVYLLCWTPFAAVIVKRYRLPDEADAVTDSFRALWYAAHYLMYANAAVNPIVYWATNETFRRGFRETFVARSRRQATSAARTSGEAEKSAAKPVDVTQMSQLATEKEKSIVNVTREDDKLPVLEKDEAKQRSQDEGKLPEGERHGGAKEWNADAEETEETEQTKCVECLAEETEKEKHEHRNQEDVERMEENDERSCSR
ncbi:neuropeptide FF receptor 2-like [Amphibalanus amphitrite]|uniref:neuropeptide FF receptor 2-like n=1 Tax=Amphibalanus amphitrite TaxID=1232801 RepID=UPI001C91108A|nr:neuropeptide FF receptor 2-like [Amphibalanus amphitrite]